MKIGSCAFLLKARSEGLITKEVEGELLIYDRARDRAHCLNESAAAIWKLCNGRRSVSEISAQWAVSSEQNPESSERIVWLALDQLRRSHLLEETNGKTFWPPALSEITSMSRREAVRRIGLSAAIAMPLVIAMTAPTPAEAAASCKHHCDTCSSPIECCGTCSTNVPGCMGSPRCT